MPGVYPNYTYSAKSLKYDIPGRDDIWNGQDGNDINSQIITHQAILSGLTSQAVIRTVLDITTNQSTYTINTSQYNIINITGQSVGISGFLMIGGTPKDGDTLRISVTGISPVTISFPSSYFEASSIPLPTTTTGNSRLDVGFLWNTSTNLWRVVAVS